jgi:serine protease Do
MKKFLGVLISFVVLLTSCTPHDIALAKRCQSSTVVIHMKVSENKDGKNREGWGTCSGVYVSPNVILTANHCIDMPEGVTLHEIWVRNVYDESDKATVIKASPARDLALLKTNLKGTPIRLARKIKLGEEVWIVGNPLGLEFVVSKGIVSATNVEFNAKNPIEHFLTDTVVLPGNSGGPAFNSKGQLIGIVVRSTSMLGTFGASGLGLVVQIDEVRRFLKSN